MFHFDAPPPLSLYVHLPWCLRKCPYCDFNSYAIDGPPPEEDYVAALLRDLEAEAPEAAGRTVGSIFIGGGTPSLFSPEAVAALLSGVRTRLSLAPDAEVTLEANPGTFELHRFAGFCRAGVTRLSIGVQSLDDAALRALGRVHDRTEALDAIAGARRAGFDNINVDLMYGLPGQDAGAALVDLEAVVALQPDHVSYYQLTLEPQTPFYHRPPPLPATEALWLMQQQGQTLLAAHGYGQYEVSAYARPGRRCRHNLNYWHYGDYLGIGAGAHAKLTDAPGGRIRRRWKVKHPRQYLLTAGTPRAAAGAVTVAAADAVFEFMLNALRLRDGFDLALFGAHTGLAAAALEPGLCAAAARGLLRREGGRVTATERGWRFLDDVATMFLPAAGAEA